MPTRRELLFRLPLVPSVLAAGSPRRTYHLCVTCDSLDAEPEWLSLIRGAGVTHVWVAGYFYGHWHYAPERIGSWLRRIRKAGLSAGVVNLPLGHPGDSLGGASGQPPLIPPPHWRQTVRWDGKRYWGTSLHEPATRENAEAVHKLHSLGAGSLFLDDDFRVARGPGEIGGCFCDEHWTQFSRSHGLAPFRKEELITDIRDRRATPLLRSWVDDHCRRMTECFRAMQAAAPDLPLGVMVMWLGAEKAGLRLSDYRPVPFRVGELMFRDRDFAPVKGKTDELFSSLFHRRTAAPELAFSETTAFPSDQLSAANMAAKLAISTLSDVRNTMFMSGIAPFPSSHWQTLAPAMRGNARIHDRIAGHRPRGPFKHYWGEASRYAGDDKPFSLFLASGVPFEVCDRPPAGGWTFLAEADEAEPMGATEAITRRTTPETMADLFALKRRILPRLASVPHVEEEKPVVCCWLPTARRVLLWNLAERRESFTLRHGAGRRIVTLDPLALADVPDIGDS